MAGEGTVGDLQVLSKLVHVHAIAFKQNLDDFNSYLRAKGFENIQSFF